MLIAPHAAKNPKNIANVREPSRTPVKAPIDGETAAPKLYIKDNIPTALPYPFSPMNCGGKTFITVGIPVRQNPTKPKTA
jgi:hypothetical protein